MARASGIAVENNFRNGLITEATGLNFPESACTDLDNCVFNIPGNVTRRLGFEFEGNYSTKVMNRTDGVVQTYRWNNVAGDGTVILVVVQVGNKLYFYDASSNDPISGHPISDYISLTVFSPDLAPDPGTIECQFADGNGLLFVVHPYLEAFSVSYSLDTHTFTTTKIDVKIRDFEGVDDSLDIDTRPTSGLSGLSPTHHYNLLNQGWNDTNLAIWDKGGKTLDPTTNTYVDIAGRTDMPSNCDVMWTYKNTNDKFDLGEVDLLYRGNSPAPKGHYVFSVFNQDRSKASELVVTGTDTGYNRFSAVAFFAGRVFYSGLNYTGFNGQVFFSQIIERDSQFGECHQVNDPTSEDSFDLLASDGGTMKIYEAGTILKMMPTSFGLLLFATNGVWLVSGSTGIGFTATDFTVTKISNVRTLTATSFVEVNGSIAWWNLEGIYSIGGSASAPTVVSMTETKIKSFYNTIPPSAKRKATGVFNPVTGIIQWYYRNTDVSDITTLFEVTNILNYSTITGAFYTWSLPSTTATKLHGAVVVENLGGLVTIKNVIDRTNVQVVDNNGDNVIEYAIANGVVIPKFKYLVSYPAGPSTYRFTWAEEWDDTYLDWTTQDGGVDYLSYFDTGYKVHGQGMKKFQSNYVNVYSNNSKPTEYYFQGLWDYANIGDSGRWSSKQYISHSNVDFSYIRKRLKVRGAGTALQFKVSSVTGKPFNIVGWSVLESVNTLP